MDSDTSLATQPLVNGVGGTDTDLADKVADDARPYNIGSQQSAFTRLLNKINTKYSSNVITEDYRYGNRRLNTNQTDEAKLGLKVKDSVFVPIVNGSSEEMLLHVGHGDESDLDNISEKLEHLDQNLEQLGQNLELLEKLQEQEAEVNGGGLSSVINGGYVSDSCSERDPNITQTKYMVKVTKLDGIHNGEKHKERIHLPAKENIPGYSRQSLEVRSSMDSVRISSRTSFLLGGRVQTSADILTTTGLIVYLCKFFSEKPKPVAVSRLTLVWTLNLSDRTTRPMLIYWSETWILVRNLSSNCGK